VLALTATADVKLDADSPSAAKSAYRCKGVADAWLRWCQSTGDFADGAQTQDIDIVAVTPKAPKNSNKPLSSCIRMQLAAIKGVLPLCNGSAASAVGFMVLSVLRPNSRSTQIVIAFEIICCNHAVSERTLLVMGAIMELLQVQSKEA